MPAEHNIDRDTKCCRVCRQEITGEGDCYCPGEPPPPPPRAIPKSFMDNLGAIGDRMKEIQTQRTQKVS